MNKILTLALLGGCATMVSCIGEEPLNAECDIESVSVHMDDPTRYLFRAYDTLQVVSSTADSVGFIIRSCENVDVLPVTISTTAGAKLYLTDENGTEALFCNGSGVDFSDEKVRLFRVVSEDGAWSRNYKINFVHDIPTEGDLHFDFEDYALESMGKFYEWSVKNYQPASFFTDGMWKNGNPGFKLSKSSALPLDYPSVPLVGAGPDGSSCVKLETRDTGSFGVMVNMRLASGSMFNGIFDVSNALKDALKATQFGSPFAHKPIKLTAWLKYEPGVRFQDKKGAAVDGVTDEPDAYVVLYKNQDEAGNKVQLDGNDVLSSPYIVGVGRLPHNFNADGSDRLCDTPIHGLTSEWQLVEIPVVYRKEVDPELLADKGYNLVIGFASSWQGAYFQGAVGSKLYIDNVSVYCDKDDFEEE